MTSNVFNMEFPSLASKQRTPQSRTRNRRGPEKESFFKSFEAMKIRENHWNSWVLISISHHPPPEEFYAHLTRFPCCLQLSILQQQGRALGCSPGPPAAPGVKQPQGHGVWKMLCSPEGQKTRASPQEGSGNIALLCMQKWGLLPGDTLETLAFCSIYTSENSTTSQKNGADTYNVFSWREIELTIFL